MPSSTFLARIERVERAAKAKTGQEYHADCICFPEKEQPFFGLFIELEIASKVRCPLHGERFKPQRFFVYVSRWLREKLWKHLWSHHSEQYRKAWFASFPPDLWPAEEEQTDNGQVFLRLKDGTKLLASESTWSQPKREGQAREAV
jgi:hypothetical protein